MKKYYQEPICLRFYYDEEVLATSGGDEVPFDMDDLF